MIRYALLLRYTSLQSYKLLLEKFPLPSISLLNKLQAGGIDAIKAIKFLLEKGEISNDIVLMLDEMYLQKGTQFHGGKYIGADEEGNHYKGVVVLMIAGLKKSIPYVIKACPETSVHGQWLAEEIAQAISTLVDAGFNVRGVVTDNHSANVNAFNTLLKNYETDPSRLFIKHPSNQSKTYLFYDNVHLVKNIRNNLLNAKKFVFPEFSMKIKDEVISSQAGYISWADLHRIYDEDSKLPANLRKAHKLTYRALHPGNNKQCVNLALAIFNETTIAAIRSYCPKREDMAAFLELILKWWTIVNSSTRFTPNNLGNAIIFGDGKTDFLRSLADWIELWSESPAFCLSKQTSDAFIRTLRAQASLIDELLDEGYDYVIPRKLQSDPLENRFSQYRQMSGGRFLVSLCEVNYSERILACRSLLLEDVNFWREDLSPNMTDPSLTDFSTLVGKEDSHLYEASLTNDSEEVATTIAGYVAKKLSERSKCDDCKSALVSAKDAPFENNYFHLLSRGGLTIPSPHLAEFVINGFALLDTIDEKIMKFPSIPTKTAAEFVLRKYSQPVRFTCEHHLSWGLQFSIKTIINIFYNNKQKISTDSVRKDGIAGFKRRQREKSK